MPLLCSKSASFSQQSYVAPRAIPFFSMSKTRDVVRWSLLVQEAPPVLSPLKARRAGYFEEIFHPERIL